MPHALFKTFTDELTGKQFILVEQGPRASLWDRDEIPSNDLMEDIENWLAEPLDSDEDPLVFSDEGDEYD